MASVAEPVAITRALVETLTIEAMVLADEAESYFGTEPGERQALDQDLQVAFACEAFRTAARLKQLVGWLSGSCPATLLSIEASGPELPELPRLPARARALVAATLELCERVRRLQNQPAMPPIMISPARVLQERLVASLAS